VIPYFGTCWPATGLKAACCYVGGKGEFLCAHASANEEKNGSKKINQTKGAD
jgi:hypothetical protein